MHDGWYPWRYARVPPLCVRLHVLCALAFELRHSSSCVMDVRACLMDWRRRRRQHTWRSHARAGRIHGADFRRSPWLRGLRAAAAGCRRRQGGQEQGLCESVRPRLWMGVCVMVFQLWNATVILFVVNISVGHLLRVFDSMLMFLFCESIFRAGSHEVSWCGCFISYLISNTN